jgi:TetR/AcrR family transcriptional regulator
MTHAKIVATLRRPAISPMQRDKKTLPSPSPEPRRGKGRPSSAQAAVGRDRILELTAEFLKANPVSHLTTAGVAKAAGVDAALVRYYFGSKDNLLVELISKITADRVQASFRFLSDSGPVEERFKRRVRALLEVNTKNPFYHDLMVERIFGRDDDAAKAVLEDLASWGLRLANKTMDDKNVRKVDAAFMHMMLVGACSFFVSAQPLLEALGTRGGERSMDAYADFVADVMMNGLRPR